jgi:hypothetical protein
MSCTFDHSHRLRCGMGRRWILSQLAVMVALAAGFTIRQVTKKTPSADWQAERVLVYGRLRDLKERNRELDPD